MTNSQLRWWYALIAHVVVISTTIRSHLYLFLKQAEVRSSGELFCPVWQRVQIKFILSNNERVLYLSSNVINPKLSNNSRTKRRFKFFYGAICEVRAYTLTISYRRQTWIIYQDKTISSQYNIIAQIEAVHDKH